MSWLYIVKSIDIFVFVIINFKSLLFSFISVFILEIKLFNKYKEIIMYLIMGGATTVVNWVTYSVMITICHPGQSLSGLLKISANTIDVFIANIVAWTVAVIFAYITNKKVGKGYKIFTFVAAILVFASTLMVKQHVVLDVVAAIVVVELGLFLSARILTGLIEIFGVPFLVDHGFDQAIFGLRGSVCKIAMSFFVVLLNYVFSKLVIFKKDKSEEE